MIGSTGQVILDRVWVVVGEKSVEEREVNRRTQRSALQPRRKVARANT